MIEIIISILVMLFVGLIVYDILIPWYKDNRCPNCKTNFLNTVLEDSDDLGPDFTNPKYTNYRNYYRCDRCGHQWSEDCVQSKNGD